MALDAGARATLLRAARQSIEHTLAGNRLSFENDNSDAVLHEKHASFVTLKRHGALRGCIGTLEATRSLLQDVIHNARAAAFQDSRFPALTQPELAGLHIEISVLSIAVPITARNRVELLQLLQPGKDGLIVQEGARRATFLPSVWESLPDADDFFDQLMQKAGLGAAYWSSSLKLFRYQTDNFGDDAALS